MKAIFRDRELLVHYLLASCLFLVLSGSSLWYLYDGSTFHLYNFLTGLPNNARDFGRLGAILFTDWVDLFYIRLGGESFVLSRHLYVLGQSFHLFLPLFFLSYVKNEERVSYAWYYLVSLLLVRGIGLYFFVSELYAYHTVSWLSLFAVKSGRRKFHWITTFYSVFTYPAALFLNIFLFIRERKLLYPVFALIVVLFHFDYSVRYPNLPPFFETTLSHFPTNWTVHLYLGLFFLIFLAKKSLALPAALLAALCYISLGFFSFGHMFQGRSIALLVMLALQVNFLFPLLPLEKFRERGIFLCLISIVLISYHVYQLEEFQSALKELLIKEERVMSFHEAEEKLSAYPGFVRPFQARIQSIDLMLMNSKEVKAFVQPKFLQHQDLMHAWNQEELLELFRRKGITFSENARNALPKDSAGSDLPPGSEHEDAHGTP